MAATWERLWARNDAAAEVAPWFAEFRRLFNEAEKRFGPASAAGRPLELATNPLVHDILVDGCGAILDTTEEGSADAGPSTSTSERRTRCR